MHEIQCMLHMCLGLVNGCVYTISNEREMSREVVYSGCIHVCYSVCLSLWIEITERDDTVPLEKHARQK